MTILLLLTVLALGPGGSSPVLWIRIRIGMALLDPGQYCECESGSGSRSMEIDQNYQVNFVSRLSKRLLYLRRYRYQYVF